MYLHSDSTRHSPCETLQLQRQHLHQGHHTIAALLVTSPVGLIQTALDLMVRHCFARLFSASCRTAPSSTCCCHYTLLHSDHLLHIISLLICRVTIPSSPGCSGSPSAAATCLKLVLLLCVWGFEFGPRFIISYQLQVLSASLLYHHILELYLRAAIPKWKCSMVQ